ncbi:STAS domain-containing protein [Streptomyces sp. ICBB 8177]|uniref:STAS domain-containing protein n=1 Tax=Streptomyces sp. ICBB 8177 TaxID=563922 RepID=UPI000D67CBBC|nr:STAS domain-containing protein [Streptomyces sp. ICBB 8177]PWI45090.1 hypothetical protein CK485_07975 [Streptomyces sp. ICBB 8177]
MLVGPTPVLTVGDILLVCVGDDLGDDAALALQEDIAAAIEKRSVRAVVIDVSSVGMVDSFLGRILAEIAACAHLLAAQAIVVGMRPAVAITLVELGLTLPGLRTALDVGEAFATLGVVFPPIGNRAEAGGP